MASKMVFERYELKYLLTKDEYYDLKKLMENYMELDEYGNYSINNIYFDTPSYQLIRESLAKPLHKEKLRVRSYGKVSDYENVFVELKRKFKGVVYKRRITIPHNEAFDYLVNGVELNEQNQISKEIDYFLDYYDDLQPVLFLGYDREGYFGKDDNDFRITFDYNITTRDFDLDLTNSNYGAKLLEEDIILLEVKTSVGLPFWLINFFNENEIYKTSFSKYGTAYKKFIYDEEALAVLN